MKNHGWDNNNDDLIMFTGDVLEPAGSGKRWVRGCQAWEWTGLWAVCLPRKGFVSGEG